MRRLTLFLNYRLNRIVLETPLQTSTHSVMTVKNVSMFWNSVNITNNINDTVELNETITLGEGYWTFEMMKSFFQKYGIIMVANEYDNTCSIQPTGHDLDLRKLGPLLGFPEDTVIPANSWRT